MGSHFNWDSKGYKNLSQNPTEIINAVWIILQGLWIKLLKQQYSRNYTHKLNFKGRWLPIQIFDCLAINKTIHLSSGWLWLAETQKKKHVEAGKTKIKLSRSKGFQTKTALVLIFFIYFVNLNFLSQINIEPKKLKNIFIHTK